MKTRIRRLLQINNDGGCGKYLGLPEQFGSKKVELFQYIVEKVRARTEGWSNKFLSPGGKEILLKSIAMAMPVYTMNCFKLPKTICDEIERLMSNYWWNTTSQDISMHWFAWDRMKFSKKEGGLGFRDLENFNNALLAKQVWRVYQNPDCLMARVLKGRYFAGSNIFNASRGYRPSFGWQSIIHGRDLLKQGMRFLVGDGSMIQTWLDPWLPVHPPRPPRRKDNAPFDVQLVSDLILPNRSGWNESLVRAVIHEDDVSQVLLTKISRSQCHDFLGWHYSDNGVYTVKSGYWLATHPVIRMDEVTPPPGDVCLKARLWKLNVAPKIKHFIWRLLSGALATGSELERRHIVSDSFCRRCVVEVETSEHLFFSCPHAIQIWRATGISIPCLMNPLLSVEIKFKALLDWAQCVSVPRCKSVVPFWILWRLWISRNKLVFERQSNSWRRDFREALQDTEDWLSIGSGFRTEDVDSMVFTGITHTARWKKPHEGWTKCNYDGSFLNPHTKATSAFLFRDAHGCFLAAAQVTGGRVFTALEAECQSLLMAMQNAWIKGYRKVIFEGDCQTLVNCLLGKIRRFDVHNWISDINDWSQRFEEVAFSWVKRVSNQPADKLARLQHAENNCFKFHSIIPVEIRDVLHSDNVLSS